MGRKNRSSGTTGFRLSRLMCRCMVLLACMLLATEAGAAGRESGARATAKSDRSQQSLESWLARLKGSFTIKFSTEEKIGNCRAVTGGFQECTRQEAVNYVSAATCRGIDGGPDVECTFDELRREGSGNGAADDGARGSSSLPGLLSSVNNLPRRMSLGIDQATRKINLTIVDGTATGSLAGDEVNFKGRCDRPESKSPCTWTLSIHAPPDGKRILIKRARPNLSGVRSDSLLLADLNGPRTFELNRVEQPESPQE